MKKRHVFACMTCLKVTSTTSKSILGLRMCKECRSHVVRVGRPS